jgi:acylphosphatase
MTRRYLVTGRVQGVGFRWFVEREARALGVGGWVRNNDNGAVEVLASGTADQLARLRRALEQGPRAARVDEVQEFEEEREASETSFRIEGAW